MKNKYVIANIKIPMELKEDNTIYSYSEYINMDFEKIDDLPEISKIKFNDNYIKNIINNFYSQESELEPQPESESKQEPKTIIITEEELKKGKNKNNRNRITSFKLRENNSYRHTARTYNSNH